MKWTPNYIHHKVLDEITYPFPNFNGCTIQFIPKRQHHWSLGIDK